MGRVRRFPGKEANVRCGRDALALPPHLPEPRARGRAALQRRPRRPAEPPRAARPPRAVREPAARIAAGAAFHRRRLSAAGARRVAPGGGGGDSVLRAAPRADTRPAAVSRLRALFAEPGADRAVPPDVRP